MAGPARYSNRWDFWAFPRKNLLAASPVPIELQAEWSELRHVYPWLRAGSEKMTPKSLLISESLSERAISHLHHGGRVLLIMKQQPADLGIPFFPASGGAMGTLIPDSAALGDFPNQGFADLQFYNLLNGTSPIPLDAWPAELKPIVGAIRTTSEFLSQQKGLSRVGYVFQARVGGGELLVTSYRASGTITTTISIPKQFTCSTVCFVMLPATTLHQGLRSQTPCFKACKPSSRPGCPLRGV